MAPENDIPLFSNDFNRRNFITTAVKAAGAGLLMSSPLSNLAEGAPAIPKDITVGEIMDSFIKEIPGAPFENTVDTLKAGSRDIVVTGIVTSMFATVQLIHKTIALGANFIIAHEPTFYNHLDETAWLEKDEVYRHKAALLKQHGIAVWRNHDYIHSHTPDGVQTGVIARLGWKSYPMSSANIVTLPATTLRTLIQHVKQKLGIPMVRYIGDPGQSCKKILLMPGAAG